MKTVSKLLIASLFLLQACGPSKDASGNEWGRWHVWRRVTAGKTVDSKIIHQTECTKP
jgi:hypothetical protein